MSLRVRLIVAFLVLSVIPLGAVTWHSYSNSTSALQEAAEEETRVLARELGRRIRSAAREIGNRDEDETGATGRQVGAAPAQFDDEGDVTESLATVFAEAPSRRGDIQFAIAQDGYVYARTAEDRREVSELGEVLQDSRPGTTWLSDWIVVTTEDPSGSGLRLGIARPVREALKEIQSAAVHSAGLGLVFIGAALLCVLPLSSRLTRNLSRLGDGAQRIADGDYRARVEVRTGDEVGRLAATFNQMAQNVERHQLAAIERERIGRELELGRQIQRGMLPRAPWQRESIHIAALTIPAREVGGDFFNYFDLPDGRIALMMGDASGKGVGAALHMANLQASLRARLSLGQDLESLFLELDANAESSSPGSMYATLFVGLFDTRTRLLRYVNAGHYPPCVRRSDGSFERLLPSGLPVGLLAGGPYEKREVALEPGDLVLFYTDGCIDVEDELGNPFGTDALERTFLGSTIAEAEGSLREIDNAIQQFRGSRELPDDATMMVVSLGQAAGRFTDPGVSESPEERRLQLSTAAA